MKTVSKYWIPINSVNVSEVFDFQQLFSCLVFFLLYRLFFLLAAPLIYFTVPPTGKTCCLLTWNELLRAFLCQCVLCFLLELKITKQIRSMLPSQRVTELDGSGHSRRCTYQQLQYRELLSAHCKLLKAVLGLFKWGPWSKAKHLLRLLCLMKWRNVLTLKRNTGPTVVFVPP